jgi:thioesterase domain-containing protein
MTTHEFLQQLRTQDVRLWADGDRLRVNAPHGLLTPELQAELASRKVEIRAFLEANASGRSSLVPIQPSGSRPAFYMVTADGDIFAYVRLAHQLGPDHPFYAFEAPGIDGTQPPVASIERLAARYLADLRAFQPCGPYFIGGFCLGGIVAFELARQLRAQGQDVALLALFESPSLNGLKSAYGPAGRFRRRQAEIFERVRKLSGQRWSERLAFLRSRLVRILHHDDLARTGDPARGRRNEQKDRVFRTTLQAAYSYVARPYPGRIVLFLGSQELKRRRAYLRQLDWARVAVAGLEVNVGIDGCTHYPMILTDPPHVRALAKLLKPYIKLPLPCRP